mmetsp:Transcript_12248/g.17964  ORF Transcript_12248/g.17964 Transcript_12248/m.17964 type:complete len:919 (-) Transcript_12248:104-2860(-)|eukprot:CAMPEP_0194026392 /NCGR_PEP_ID=MMETSP0009_2-20130614/713_1 /TAXON_ID=210454 /ORGANISM="Grammatophora oceanica, Strain CCMP 410" /LENGTH=918 /DNA_ID=CAMNT_0038665065 /DNA_START=179 /DNA_END=2935 /DNA_ORIENTATION=-
MAGILEEAQALMDELNDDNEGVASADGGTRADSLVIDGFSIDDDEDAGIVDIALEDSPKAAEDDGGGKSTTVLDDPLSAALQEPSTSGISTSASGTPTTTSPPPEQETTPRRSSTLTLHPLQDELSGSNAAATPSFNDVRAQARGFASSVATFATKAATNIAQQAAAAQAAATQQANGFSTNMAPIPGGVVQSPGVGMVPGTTTPPTGGASPPTPPQVPHLDNEQKQALIHQHLGDLLPGERVIMFLTNLLHVSDSTGNDYSTRGGGMWCCCMTYYRVVLFCTTKPHEAAQEVLAPPSWAKSCWPSSSLERPNLLQMPLSSIDRVEKSIYQASSPSAAGGASGASTSMTTLMGLMMYGKDNGRQLRFTTPSYADTLRVHESIQTYAFPGRRNLGYLFAFESKRNDVMASIQVDPQTGAKQITLPPLPKRFDGPKEYARQFGSMSPCPWTIYTQLNGQYQLCMSYPNVLVGPSSLHESNPDTLRLLRQTAAFRSEQRLPSLTWSNGKDGASLWRASQPKVGLQGNRSGADELYLKHIMEAAMLKRGDGQQTQPKFSKQVLSMLTGSTDPKDYMVTDGCLLKIMDMRPRASAMANRTGGYGYENTAHYPGTTLQFCNIGNIHAVRDAYQKMSNICLSQTTSDVTFGSAIEDSRWLSMVRLILAAGWEAAFWVEVHRLPVLLHCSHGWDRTSQVAAIAQLLLDPYYRTLEGFSTLVEKDFMSFGHPFHTRCAHGEGRGADQSSSGSDEGQISQIFMQFLDCVYQLVAQYPESFEFNTKYVLVLSEHVYSSRFGNMLCDTERERELVAGIRQRTHSVWDYLAARSDVRYAQYSPTGIMLMPLPTLMRNVHLWVDRHCMYGPKPTLRESPDRASAVTSEGVLPRDQQGLLRCASDLMNELSISSSGMEDDGTAKDNQEPAVEA